ncbi:TonB-dependent receptor [Geothrix alkalitolerans]|uniref:TonB-dependent receptor n=1 Tax=Geothrix alkalitolerans TaxID=2922724 RepID=UPI001FAFAE54|nr:TonB-dependent receptor [Geothrix alkalitolerans]
MHLSPSRMARTTALLVAMGATAFAAGDGNLYVKVLDSQGKPVAGATVIVTSPTQIGGARTVPSDKEGNARFIRLSPGDFKVQVSKEGFQTATLSAIEVKVDQTSSANLKLQPLGSATVEVVSNVAAVDSTTVTTGTQITSTELETLPVGRTQLSTLNLAPGVIATLGNTNGNPTLATGLNRDNFGSGGGRNNTYLVDGVDVTSPEAGTLRTTIAPELIQVQDVKTGAITAEYTARAGLFSSVTTKVGGNEFSGGVTVDYQSPSLQNKVGYGKYDVGERSVRDYSAYFMGPIIKDKLWFVGSVQSVKDELTVKLPSGESRTGLNEDSKRFFGKLTWQISPEDLLSFTYNTNPYDFNNLSNPGIVTRRAAKTEQGGNRWIAAYSHQFTNLFVDVHYSHHQEDNKVTGLYTDAGPQNTIVSLSALTPDQAQQGNSSAMDLRVYKKDLLRADLTWLFSALGNHTVKFGGQSGEDSLTRTSGISQGAAYESFDLGTYTWGALPGGQVRSQRARVLGAINNTPSLKATAIAAGYTPTGTGGVFQSSDFNSYTFNEANPIGGYYGYRNNFVSSASSTPKQLTQGFYLQDQWQVGRFTLSPGFRFDKYEYKADNGQSLFKTDYNFAPRVGATYDVKGDGHSKIYAYWGRYIDPIRLDMVRFTGSLQASATTEDVRMFNTWITAINRGTKGSVDAVFVDKFKLPKTDEFRLGYATDFARIYSFEIVGTLRRDFDIVEDWDIGLYSSADNLEGEARALWGMGSAATTPYANLTTQQKRVVDYFRGLAMPVDYFAGGGFSGAQNLARANAGQLNFALANLPGGVRKYKTLDLTLTRRESNNWGGFASVSLVDGQGNSFSLGNADYQGDLAQYDPRLPYMNGKLDGSVDWMAKFNAFYHWDMGLQVAMNFNANSGYHYSASDKVGTRVLNSAPKDINDVFTEQAGKYRTPNFWQSDIRVQYAWKWNQKLRSEVYLDIINLTNRQEVTGVSEGLNVRSGTTTIYNAAVAGQPYAFQAPRRYQMGFRLKF